MAVSEFEEFRKAVVEQWKKRRLPSFIRKRALRYLDTYDNFNNEKWILAWMQFDNKVYAVDIWYSYKQNYLSIHITELPAPYEKLKDWPILLIRAGKTVYGYDLYDSEVKERDTRG